ncbi:MAG: hypothetical protein WCK02_15380 [Bacteroidota bacterium]
MFTIYVDLRILVIFILNEVAALNDIRLGSPCKTPSIRVLKLNCLFVWGTPYLQ